MSARHLSSGEARKQVQRLPILLQEYFREAPATAPSRWRCGSPCAARWATYFHDPLEVSLPCTALISITHCVVADLQCCRRRLRKPALGPVQITPSFP